MNFCFAVCSFSDLRSNLLSEEVTFDFFEADLRERRPLLAEGHGGALEHHRGVGQPGCLADAVFRDEAGIGELDLPVVA